MANLPSLSDIKTQAKTFTKFNRVKYKDALDLSAQSYGFTSYKTAQTTINFLREPLIKRPPEGGLIQGVSETNFSEGRIKV